MRDRSFRALIAPNSVGHPRLGLSVPKRRVGRATRRNRLRRLVRETLRTRAGRLPPVDMVFVFLGGVKGREKVPGAEIRAEVCRLADRIASRPPT